MSIHMQKAAIYLVCFHSEKPETLRGAAGQYLTVERAVQDGEWPYDNGDDPSFYVVRHGGPLTWGVCRQDLRNAIPAGSIVAFFSFTSLPNKEVLYRLCAVTTVVDKVDHRVVDRDPCLSPFRHLYINALIRPEKDGWRYDETDRRPKLRHADWLWRIADHRGMRRQSFEAKYAQIYRDEWFSEHTVVEGEIRLARNYVLFSTAPDETYISPAPPEVAIAVKGNHEDWSNLGLRSLTVDVAAKWLRSGRSYLRVKNKSGRNVHRQIHFDMPAEQAEKWRADLMAALRAFR